MSSERQIVANRLNGAKSSHLTTPKMCSEQIDANAFLPFEPKNLLKINNQRLGFGYFTGETRLWGTGDLVAGGFPIHSLLLRALGHHKD